jgi:hypothetical protein
MRDEVTGGWRKLHNEERRNLYSPPSIIRMIKSRRCEGQGRKQEWGEEEHMYDICGKTRRKETTGKTKKLVDNIKMDPREIGWDGMDSIDLAQDRDQ